MRPLVLLGLLLMAIGGFVLYNGGSFTTRKKLVEVGDVKVTAPDKHAVPDWASGAVMVLGLGLVVTGIQRRRRA
jgi:hypothetical protein